MADGLRDETKFALVEIVSRARKDRVGPAHILDIFPAGRDRRQRIEIERVGVVPAEILLVDRLHIMLVVDVVIARVYSGHDSCQLYYWYLVLCWCILTLQY